MKVLVCGGRGFADQKSLFGILSGLGGPRSPIDTIVTGGAPGADQLAEKWSRFSQVKRISYPAKWNRFGKPAGLIRNQEMLDQENPDLVIAFPGGRGTAHMVSIAKEAGYEVIEVPATGCG